MAWVRTSTSLISFGFTIYKFFQYLQDQQKAAPEGLLGPRQYATLMIAIGIIALILSTFQHRRDMKELRKHHPEVSYSLATVLAGFRCWASSRCSPLSSGNSFAIREYHITLTPPTTNVGFAT